MVCGFGGKDDARHREGIALEASSGGLSGTVVAGPADRDRTHLTGGALAAIALLAATPAPAMPVGIPIHDSGLVTLAAAAVPWSVTMIGDVGGFDAGSRLTWQALGTVNYGWNENWTLHAGYRAPHVDYRKGRFLYDTTMHGPILAATYRF